jgi:hypothetical protein
MLSLALVELDFEKIKVVAFSPIKEAIGVGGDSRVDEAMDTSD